MCGNWATLRCIYSLRVSILKIAACKSVICLPLMVGNVWAMLHPTMMIYIFDLQTEGAGFNNFFSF